MTFADEDVQLASHARAVVHGLGERGWTIAAAESLTCGLVTARLADVPGASAVLLGGVATYATRIKVDVLGVPQSVVDEHGVVSAACAAEMAQQVRSLCGADVGVATTGVAGPDRQDDRRVGTVFTAVAGGGRGVVAREHHLDGDRAEIRQQATLQALVDVLDLLEEHPAVEPR